MEQLRGPGRPATEADCGSPIELVGARLDGNGGRHIMYVKAAGTLRRRRLAGLGKNADNTAPAAFAGYRSSE